MAAMVPPLLITRIIAQYHFEGGAYVAVVSGGTLETMDALDAIQKMIDLKRAEMSGLIKFGEEGRTGSKPDLNTSSPEVLPDTGCTHSPILSSSTQE